VVVVEISANGKAIESVWDYPRPPRLEPVDWRIRVIHAGATIVDAPHAIRVLETSQPPAYYVSDDFVDRGLLVASERHTFCEWKGLADYVDIVVGDVRTADAGWSYPAPDRAFEPIRGHWAFYAQRCDECWIDDEQVTSNEGGFYGGWVTANVIGPFKGAPGTSHW
jgi:uncharacterized protein (DUF427 family)